jgi:hypothetical protein
MRMCLYFTVIIHFIAVVGNLASIIYLLIYSPWYVCFPAITFVVDLAVNNWKCPLTMLENSIRIKLGMPVIRGFIGHYFLPKKDG